MRSVSRRRWSRSRHRQAGADVTHPRRRRASSSSSTRATGRRARPQLHVHHEHADCFYVLEGALTLTLESGERMLGPGRWASCRPMSCTRSATTGRATSASSTSTRPVSGFDRYLQGLYDAERSARLRPAPRTRGRRPRPWPRDRRRRRVVAERPRLEATVLVDADELVISRSKAAPRARGRRRTSIPGTPRPSSSSKAR